MLNIYKDTIIYVLCPAKIVTGGIEAIHQLVHKLRRFGHDARIVPTPAIPNPVLLQYRNYDVAFDSGVVDSERHVLITSEVNPRGLDAYYSIQKALWWLSVDNHEALKDQFQFGRPETAGVVHFVQSAYAASFLERKGQTDFFYLTDYLHPVYFSRINPQQKNDVVLYTPVKGAQHFIDRLMRGDSSIQWLPLTGMIRKLHAQTMRRGKVYVDFGRHPGKDRQPREAVVNGCCVLVGQAGAARFQADVPIPDSYKFDMERLETERILETIRACLVSYETRRRDFADYAKFVREDEHRFEEEIKAIFGIKESKASPLVMVKLSNTLAFSRQNDAFTTARGLMNELLPLSVTRWSKQLYLSTRGGAGPGRR
ncbi:MAG: hypothetical protein VKO26_01935 [Cyanobacteriota bacterium]|nr:hypothetical protein [Cyanobacteriota bacterium]